MVFTTRLSFGNALCTCWLLAFLFLFYWQRQQQQKSDDDVAAAGDTVHHYSTLVSNSSHAVVKFDKPYKAAEAAAAPPPLEIDNASSNPSSTVVVVAARPAPPRVSATTIIRTTTTTTTTTLHRRHVFDLSEFGAVGDGKTVNTEAFEEAVAAVKAVEDDGGGKIVVGPGLWLTAPFNVTSHMTLFLCQHASIVGVQAESLWPVISALPSYGRGRELPGPRYGSLIHGRYLEDFVITGENGSIDGQGAWWWRQHKLNKLKYTRGHLIELLWSSNIEISNVTLRNSPFWTVHPYDCTNVTIRGVTILAPLHSPNTDGIDPGMPQPLLPLSSILNTHISSASKFLDILSNKC
jgi:polygalacturonase